MIILSIILILLAILGAPLFTIISASAMLGYMRTDTDLMNVPLEILGLGSMPFLSAILLFTFAGYLQS